MHRWTLVVAVGLALAQGTLGCAAAQPKMKRDLEVMQRESAPGQLVSRGVAFAAVGDMTRAEQYFVAALRAGGESAELTRRLIAVCTTDGRYPSALAYADEYLRKHPGGSDIRFAAATIKMALGDGDGARADLKHVILIQPSFGEAHYALAQIDRDGGDVMAADAEFREYLRVAPSGEHAEEARASLMRTVP